MYVKIDEIKGLLVHSTLSDQDLRQRLIGMLDPIRTYTQEQVDQEQAPPVDETKDTTDAGDEQNGKQGTHSRKLGFDRLEEVITAMIEKNGPPRFFEASFHDYVTALADSTNTIELFYSKQEAAEMIITKSAVKKIVADFDKYFAERYNGYPSPVIARDVLEHVEDTINGYKKSVNASNPKALRIHVKLPPKIGKCPCRTCTITPLN